MKKRIKPKFRIKIPRPQTIPHPSKKDYTRKIKHKRRN